MVILVLFCTLSLKYDIFLFGYFALSHAFTVAIFSRSSIENLFFKYYLYSKLKIEKKNPILKKFFIFLHISHFALRSESQTRTTAGTHHELDMETDADADAEASASAFSTSERTIPCGYIVENCSRYFTGKIKNKLY